MKFIELYNVVGRLAYLSIFICSEVNRVFLGATERFDY